MAGRSETVSPCGGESAARPLRVPAARGVRCWVAVVSRTHVQRGVSGGFAQACHGSASPLKRMRMGDWMVFYSPSVEFNRGQRGVSSTTQPCRAFTAIARVTGDGVYEHALSADFVPWRRNVSFYVGAREALIVPLLDSLSFIRDKRRWGFPFRRGHFEIPPADMARIAEAMGVAFSAPESVPIAHDNGNGVQLDLQETACAR